MELRMSEIVRAFDNRSLHLIIMPTEKCNFRCVYCYEDFQVGRMKDDIIEGIINLIDRRSSSLKDLNIGWFGGEPMLGFNTIKIISKEIIRICEHSDIAYYSSMSTNGFNLTVDKMQDLLDLEIDTFQITLDGDGESHDRTRVSYGGGKTFDKIWSNLISLHNSDLNFQIALRLHLTKNNLGGVRNLVNQIKKDLPDERFKVYFKAVENLSSDLDKSLILLEDDSAKLISEFKALLPSEKLTNQDLESPPICYAAKGNSLVIRPDGRVAKCTVAFNNEKNWVGNLKKDGTIDFDESKFKSWIQGTLSGNAEFARCPLPYI